MSRAIEMSREEQSQDPEVRGGRSRGRGFRLPLRPGVRRSVYVAALLGRRCGPPCLLGFAHGLRCLRVVGMSLRVVRVSAGYVIRGPFSVDAAAGSSYCPPSVLAPAPPPVRLGLWGLDL